MENGYPQLSESKSISKERSSGEKSRICWASEEHDEEKADKQVKEL